MWVAVVPAVAQAAWKSKVLWNNAGIIIFALWKVFTQFESILILKVAALPDQDNVSQMVRRVRKLFRSLGINAFKDYLSVSYDLVKQIFSQVHIGATSLGVSIFKQAANFPTASAQVVSLEQKFRLDGKIIFSFLTKRLPLKQCFHVLVHSSLLPSSISPPSILNIIIFSHNPLQSCQGRQPVSPSPSLSSFPGLWGSTTCQTLSQLFFKG